MSHYLVAGRGGGLAAPEQLDRLLAAAGPVLAMPGQRLALRVVRPAPPGRAAVVAAWSANDLPATDDALVEHIRRTSGARLTFTDGGVDLSTGVVASRTWWSASVGDATIATTSLRLAAFLLGSLDVDPEAAAWMASSGTLGPSASWDRRVRQIPALATYRIPSGELRLAPPLPEPAATAPGARDALERELSELVRAALAPVVAEPRRWVLPLSGGVDSRGLALLADGALETVTHGKAGSDRDEWSDAAIAAAVSKEFGWRNRLVAHPTGAASAELLLDNFCRASECRVDHAGGYADGMAKYDDLVARGLTGLVRGDEVFGWNRRTTEFATRDSMGALFVDDLRLPKGLADALAPLARRQQPPAEIVRRGRQSLAVYRDALYRAYRVPAVLAPLTEVKSNYVEVVTPLLDDDVVRFAAGLPDGLRTDKRFWATFVSTRSNEIPYARHRSSPGLADVLGRRDVDDLVRAALTTDDPIRAGVPEAALEILARADRGAGAGSSSGGPRRVAAGAASLARTIVPHRVRRELAIRRAPEPAITRPHAAFRAYLCGRAVALLDGAASDGRRAVDAHGDLAGHGGPGGDRAA